MATPDPLADVAFLARSAHRVEVLRTLAGGPMTRPALHEETGIPQPTLGRILEPFRDRNWVERRGGAYALTPWGHLLVDEFDDLLDTVETIRRLGTVVELLPTEEMDVDVRRFGDATVTTPEPGDLLRHVRRAEEVLSEGTDIRILAGSIAPAALEEQRDRLLVDPDLRLETVITDDALRQALAAPGVADLVRDLLESGQAPVYRYEGSFPMPILARVDDVAVLAPADDRGIPGALIESPDETIRAWVDSRIDEYREQSTPLRPKDLSE
jgi:predicted transcriptional regulator